MSLAPDSQGQYGGQLTPAAPAGSGGTAVLENLGSAAMGMLTGGGSVAIKAAMDAAKDGTNIQAATTNTGAQSTGSKVFNLSPAGDAMNNNPFWQQLTGTSTSMMPMLLGFAFLGFVLWFVFKRK